MLLTIQSLIRWSPLITGVICAAALILDPNPLPFAGILLSLLGAYAGSRRDEALEAADEPVHQSQRQQILAVLKDHYVEPLLADRKVDFQVEDVISQFDQSNGEMLITGVPGSGKTTAALCLMREMIRRAEHDEQQPVPLLLSVAQWTHDQNDPVKWLQGEVARHYAIPDKVTRDWFFQKRIVLLLDNFDDLPPDFQAQFFGPRMVMLRTIPLVCCASYDARIPALKVTFDLGSTGTTPTNVVDPFPRVPSPRARHWLSWLAGQMVHRKQHTFFIEDLNHDWLAPRQRIWAGLWARGSILLFTVIIMAIGLMIGLTFSDRPNDQSCSILDMLEGGAVIGAFWGGVLVFLLGGADLTPKAYEPMRLSLSNMRYSSYLYLWFGLAYAPAIGLLFGILPALRLGLLPGVKIGVIAALFVGIGQAVILILSTISAPGHIETNPRPNMHLSYAVDRTLVLLLRMVVLSGGPVGLGFALRFGEIGEGVYFGLALGLIMGTFVSLIGGGIAVFRHVIMRLILYRSGHLPLNVADFLNAMADQGILVQVSSGFQFRDKTTLAAFAELSTESPVTQDKPDTGEGWQVPYSVEMCRERITAAVNAASSDIQKEFGGLAVRFTKAATDDNWEFVIFTNQSSDSGADFLVTGTLSARTDDTTYVKLKARAATGYWFILLSGFGMGALFGGYGILETSEPFALACGLPTGLLMLFISIMLWANGPGSVDKLQRLVLEALDLPHETHLAPWQSTVTNASIAGILFAVLWGISSLAVRFAGADLSTTKWAGLGIAIGVSLVAIYSIAAALAAGVIIYWICGRTQYNFAVRVVTVLKWLNPLMTAVSHHYTFLAGEVLFRAGRYDEAEAILQISLKSKRLLDKTNTQKFEWVTMGCIQLAQENYPLAKKYLEQAHRHGIQTRSLYLALSQCYLFEGETVQALELLELAQQHSSDWVNRKIPEYIPSIIQAVYAWAYAQQNRTDAASETLAAALQPTGELYCPGEAELHYWAAQVERELGDLSSVCEHLKEAITLDPHGHAGQLARRLLAKLS